MIHLGLHQNHYVLLSKGYRFFEESHEGQDVVRGGAKGSKSRNLKDAKNEGKKQGHKFAKAAKRISKAVQEDLAKEAEGEEKRAAQSGNSKN